MPDNKSETAAQRLQQQRRDEGWTKSPAPLPRNSLPNAALEAWGQQKAREQARCDSEDAAVAENQGGRK